MARLLPALVLAIAMLSIEACAGSVTLNSSLHGYLSTYIPNSTLKNATYYSAALGHDSYVLMQRGSGNNLIVINTTNGYSIVMNVSGISAVLGPFFRARYYPNQSSLNSLKSEMLKYINQSATSLNDCLVETGLDMYTCTQANACYSCQAIPVCKNLLDALGGPGSSNAAPLINGLKNFSAQYTLLNNSYNAYFSVLSRLNASNVGSSIDALDGAVSNISIASAEMPQNPLFPLPSSYNMASLYGTCSSYSAGTQPWYCVDIGFCELTTFNSTQLFYIQSAVAQLQNSPLSNSGLLSASKNSSAIATGYVMTVVAQKENTALSALMNATEPGYNSTVQKAQALLALFKNSTLSSDLSSLESTFSGIQHAGINQNITSANIMLSNALAKTSAEYSVIYAEFAPVYAIIQQNNRLLAFDQLSYSQIPASLARAALEQQELDAKLSAGVNASQLPALVAQLHSTGSGFAFSSPFTLGAAVKAIDGGTITALLAGAASLGAKNSGAALYAAALSLVVGAVLVLLFYALVYSRLKHRHRLKLHRRAVRAWHMLFIALGVLVVIYALVTYSAASGANALLPASGFFNAVAASKSVAIAVNTTGQDAHACASAVQSSLTSAGKTVHIISVANGMCSGSGFTGACLGSVAGSMPLVLISGGNSSIAYRGMYGHVLYASGSAASGASCPLSGLFS